MQHYNLKPLQELVEEQVEPNVLACVLDEAMYSYACLKLGDFEDGLQEQMKSNLYYLRTLRDAFLAVAGVKLGC